jgi:hypothetical protein
MKNLFLTGIAALFLATGVAHTDNVKCSCVGDYPATSIV